MKAKFSRHLFVPGLVILALCFSAPIARAEAAATAATNATKGRHVKEKYDADKDGKLSEEERAKMKSDAKEHAKEKREVNEKKMLEKYDANKNGKLDPEEREKMQADRKAEAEQRKAGHKDRKHGNDSEGKKD